MSSSDSGVWSESTRRALLCIPGGLEKQTQAQPCKETCSGLNRVQQRLSLEQVEGHIEGFGSEQQACNKHLSNDLEVCADPLEEGWLWPDPRPTILQRSEGGGGATPRSLPSQKEA